MVAGDDYGGIRSFGVKGEFLVPFAFRIVFSICADV